MLLSKSLKDETYLSKYFCAFENVYCTKNCNFDNWNSLNEAERFRVLSIFLKEIVHVLYNEFSKLGRFPGRNSNRVEKINDNLFEYRISNPNYRIYYSRFENKLIILKTLLKRRQSISTDAMNNLLRLVKQPYEKTWILIEDAFKINTPYFSLLNCNSSIEKYNYIDYSKHIQPISFWELSRGGVGFVLRI